MKICALIYGRLIGLPYLGKPITANWSDTTRVSTRWHRASPLPPTGYKIMSFGIRNGSFTGVRRSDIIVGSQYAYLNARRIVNGNDRAELIRKPLNSTLAGASDMGSTEDDCSADFHTISHLLAECRAAVPP